MLDLSNDPSYDYDLINLPQSLTTIHLPKGFTTPAIDHPPLLHLLDIKSLGCSLDVSIFPNLESLSIGNFAEQLIASSMLKTRLKNCKLSFFNVISLNTIGYISSLSVGKLYLSHCTIDNCLPLTITSLSLSCVDDLQPGDIPSSVTSLQLFQTRLIINVLPLSLRSLDIDCRTIQRNLDATIQQLPNAITSLTMSSPYYYFKVLRLTDQLFFRCPTIQNNQKVSIQGYGFIDMDTLIQQVRRASQGPSGRP
ncbi:hypothetical protein SAMD00019534_049370 [Acytostelium subglobosum LB1]|uniref:hypothetical protein n=1 Tax=Acytostelium subglobosum LB1 TaxID=1410327 RepID=UPI000644FD1F|nr:hypothetical protein SAMD00019534_049370 [Acytostelium subglobosum LB1]GAM21762.1 hypothetical protein SAMD00019534_049370 [Acytostelium subglobosum LB1]|eukprot:XP_012754862.1 hypothetical protein SAMD00019534_049370 [Acytostelium subglobosum LB1]